MTGPMALAQKLWPARQPEEYDRLLNEVERAVEALSDRDREIIRRRYGFEGPKQKLAEVAVRFSVTMSAISQFEKKILDQLRLSISQKARGEVTAANFTMADLGLSPRSMRILSSAFITDPRELPLRPKEFYASLPGFGANCMRELEAALDRFRIRLESQSLKERP